MHHEHPITILRYSTKSLWLLIFPLLRGVQSVQLNVSAFYHWVQGVWFDLLVLLVILTAGFVRWYFTRFSADSQFFRFCSGVIFRRVTVIPFAKLAAVTVEQPLWLRPVLAFRLQLNTRGGSVSAPDLRLVVRRSDYRRMKQLLHVPRESADPIHHYRPGWWSMVFFSFVFSSSLSGVVYAATFFMQSGQSLDRLLDTRFTDRLTQVTEEVTAEVSDHLATYVRYAERVPPLIMSIGIVLLAAWLLSFVANMLRYIGFRYEQNRSKVHIRTGLFTRRRYILRQRLINYIDLRQNLLMKLFRVVSVNLSCAGYGYSKTELPVLIPIMTQRRLRAVTGNALPPPSVRGNRFRPSMGGFLKYLWLGLIFAAAEPVVIYLLILLLPSLESYLWFFLVMLEIPTVWFLIVKLGAWLTTGVSVQEGIICIRYCVGFRFHTVLADLAALSRTDVQISPLQRLNHKCDVRFYFHDEKSHAHPVLGLTQQETEFLLTLLEPQTTKPVP